MTRPYANVEIPTDEQIAALDAKLADSLESVSEGIRQLKAEKGLLVDAASKLLTLIERSAEGQAGPFAINNTILNSHELVVLAEQVSASKARGSTDVPHGETRG
jgi:hypothetical protein